MCTLTGLFKSIQIRSLKNASANGVLRTGYMFNLEIGKHVLIGIVYAISYHQKQKETFKKVLRIAD